MLIETLSRPFLKARSVNATDTSFPSKIPTITEPSGDAGTATGASVIDLGGEKGGVCQNGMIVLPYMIGDDDDVMAMRIIGWRKIGNNPATNLWIPVIIAELTCTGCTAVGIAARDVLNTERFCDTLALVTGNEDISIDIVSPTGNVVAHAIVDLKGFQKVEFTFDMTTGAPTSGNCLYALL